MRTAAILALALLLWPSPGGSGEIYQWVDEQGQVHWTDDLARVPAQFRDQVVEPEVPEATIQTYESPIQTATHVPEAPSDEPELHRIRFERAGLEIWVPVKLNGRVSAPFKVDTGAMVNTIPRSVVDRLGIRIEENGRKIVIAGIGGEPMLVPVVRLRSASLGDATVERVDAAVLDTMETGLLGMPFFRHFRVDINPAEGLMTLQPVDLTEVEGLHGGYPESYWRTSFRMIHSQLELIESYREQIPETFGELHERLDEAERYWKGEYDHLEIEASRAGVPRTWRD
jgi:hypothetical protein